MDDEITVRRIQPYPRKNDESGNPLRKKEDETEEEERAPAGDKKEPQPEVKDGHIDTRVSPRWVSIYY